MVSVLYRRPVEALTESLTLETRSPTLGRFSKTQICYEHLHGEFPVDLGTGAMRSAVLGKRFPAQSLIGQGFVPVASLAL